jgi:hypothetical protein
LSCWTSACQVPRAVFKAYRLSIYDASTIIAFRQPVNGVKQFKTKILRTWPAKSSTLVFRKELMNYLPANDCPDGQAVVVYQSKYGRVSKTFEALDWLARLVTQIPNKGERMVRYYGYYNN